MQRSLNWVAFTAIVALCGLPAPIPTSIKFGAAIAAEAPVWDDPSASVSSSEGVPSAANSHADTAALDEMLGDSSGQREHWTSVPDLVVLTSVMEYHSGASSEYLATPEVMSAEETKSLVADLTLALRLLTDNTFEQFATVHYQSVAAGSSVNIARPKQIVVGRYQGVLRLARTIGFGGRSTRSDGEIVGAAIVLDSEFDRTSGMRRLLRTHELGHALGFNHVKSRRSIMNPRIGPELTDFDRQVVKLAFRRPGSRPTE